MSDKYKDILAAAISLGMTLHNMIISPETDVISKNRACKFLSDAGFSNPKKLLEELVKQQKIKLRKKDGARNGKITLSAVELQRAVLEMRIKEIEI